MVLNDRQARFVEEYIIDLNATQAAIRAGYSPKTASQQGERLLRNVEIQQAICQAQQRRSRRTEIIADRVLEELAKIGFSNMGDFMTVAPDGAPRLDWSKLTRDQTAALQEVTVDEVIDREDASKTRKVKFKLCDKRAALVDIGRHLGMFKERVEVTGPNDGPQQYAVTFVREIVDPKAQDTDTESLCPSAGE